MNHSNNPVSFVKSVANLLSWDGEFIFEVPYWLETIKSLHFDQIYHEHVTYLTVRSAEKLLEMAGLHISSVEVVDYHGGSIRIAAGHAQSLVPVSNLRRYKDAEDFEDLRNPTRYEKYFSDISRRKDEFLSTLEGFPLEKDDAVFGIGAAAKANTLLTFYGLTNDKIDFILDASIHKQGKITPMTKIPIFPDSRLLGESGGVGITLAWNIGDAIKKKILEINPKVKVIGI